MSSSSSESEDEMTIDFKEICHPGFSAIIDSRLKDKNSINENTTNTKIESSSNESDEFLLKVSKIKELFNSRNIQQRKKGLSLYNG